MAAGTRRAETGSRQILLPYQMSLFETPRMTVLARGDRWVLYGPNLLLVNLRNRRVEDVIYGVFYY